MKIILISIFLLFQLICIGQSRIDIEKYDVNLLVTDTSDIIYVDVTIQTRFTEKVDSFILDLQSVDAAGKGMTLYEYGVHEGINPVRFKHDNNKLVIYPEEIKLNEPMRYGISYEGIPQNGLIIGKNRFDERTFFTDHWPNRAHHWLVCNDHPSDKAIFNFFIEAPSHYTCVATGLKVKESTSPQGSVFHKYETKIELPVKVVAVGLANFCHEVVTTDFNFPVENLVYDEKCRKSLKDLDKTEQILQFYISHVDTFPFEKLVNVQSTTMFGGMENAGNIFYDEHAFTGKGEMEALIAHEIAHQWFGNSASESDWPHFWLSEGFAVFMTDLYFKETYGEDAFKDRLISERDRVIGFAADRFTPVVDTSYQNPMELLNPNSYQKGGWFLNMLYHQLGEETFWQVIQTYYYLYRYGNASTTDFRHVVEDVTGEDYNAYFQQWLYQPGHPILETDFTIQGNGADIHMNQKQDLLFEFPLELKLLFDDGSSEIRVVQVKNRALQGHINATKSIKSIEVDPNVKLLFATGTL